MKEITLVLSLAIVASLALAGCQSETDGAGDPVSGGVTEPSVSLNENRNEIEKNQPAEESYFVKTEDAQANDLPSNLPSVLASAEDLSSDGGYLLIGEVPQEDIGIYCDNSEIRDQVYIRYGTQFQSFQQEAWIDPTILPTVEWTDWDGDGNADLVIDYLRHEGSYFDGQTTSQGVVGEQVVYQWDQDKGQWTDIHFMSQ